MAGGQPWRRAAREAPRLPVRDRAQPAARPLAPRRRARRAPGGQPGRPGLRAAGRQPGGRRRLAARSARRREPAAAPAAGRHRRDAPRQREAFLLYRYDDLRCEEIAGRMGISVRAVEKHLQLALAHCKRHVHGEAS
ncbi:sigma factor-like helix-turn-helix DNA-binding protein [Achromobacter denitrificans]